MERITMESYIKMNFENKTTIRAVNPLRFCREYLEKSPYLTEEDKEDLNIIVEVSLGRVKKKGSVAIFGKTRYSKNMGVKA